MMRINKVGREKMKMKKIFKKRCGWKISDASIVDFNKAPCLVLLAYSYCAFFAVQAFHTVVVESVNLFPHEFIIIASFISHINSI